jgi:hypothetical protein
VNASKGNPHKVEKQSSAAKKQEKGKSVDAKLKAPQTSQGKQVSKEACVSARRTRSLKNKVPPKTLSTRKKNIGHANPTSTTRTTPRQVRSSQRLRQKSDEDTAVARVIAPGPKAKGVKKSYPTCQRAAVMSDTSSSSEDENGKARCRNDEVVYLLGGGGGGGAEWE